MTVSTFPGVYSIVLPIVMHTSLAHAEINRANTRIFNSAYSGAERKSRTDFFLFNIDIGGGEKTP